MDISHSDKSKHDPLSHEKGFVVVNRIEISGLKKQKVFGYSVKTFFLPVVDNWSGVYILAIFPPPWRGGKKEALFGVWGRK